MNILVDNYSSIGNRYNIRTFRKLISVSFLKKRFLNVFNLQLNCVRKKKNYYVLYMFFFENVFYGGNQG